MGCTQYTPLVKGYEYVGRLKEGDTILVNYKRYTFDHYEIGKTITRKDELRVHHGYEDELIVTVNVYVKERKEPFEYEKWTYTPFQGGFEELAKLATVRIDFGDDDFDARQLYKSLNKENQKKVKEYIKKLTMEENGWK